MNKPNNPRYTVLNDHTAPGIVIITDNRSCIPRRFDVRNFVYGQMMYDESTANYPNYVHGEVWRLNP